jgi:signal transduction histidine kinase
MRVVDLAPLPPTSPGTASSHVQEADRALAVPKVSDPTSSMALAVLDALPVGVLIQPPNGPCWANTELRRIWRRRDFDAPGPGEFDESLEPPLRRSRSSGWPVPDMAPRTRSWTHHQLRRQDGTLGSVVVTARRINLGSATKLDATFVVEDSRSESDAHVRRAFLAMIGHELRTPITSIVGGAELLRAKLDDATRHEVTDLLIDEANHVHQLVAQLTALSTLQSADGPGPEPVHLVHLVRSVGSREAARRRIDLSVPKLDPTIPAALGDEGSISQVLAILIDNAAKHAGPGAEIRIEVERAGANVVVHVLDRGPGLPDVDRERLFELFERAGAKGAGTGIGLYVARQVITSMGGTLSAAPRAGGGADFAFSLPVAT